MELSADVYNSSSHIYSHHSVPVIGTEEVIVKAGKNLDAGHCWNNACGFWRGNITGKGCSKARAMVHPGVTSQ